MTADEADRTVLGALLEAHPRMVGLDELAAALGDLALDEVVPRLCGDGLARRLGDRVGVTRSAARFDALGH